MLYRVAETNILGYYWTQIKTNSAFQQQGVQLLVNSNLTLLHCIFLVTFIWFMNKNIFDMNLICQH